MGIIASVVSRPQTSVAVNRQEDTRASVLAIGTPTSLHELRDVDVTNEQDGSILVFKASTQKFTSVPNLDGGTF